MDGSNPKVSFIPKGSLVREESFLERRRPRSAIGFIAGVVFVLVTGAFAGLYYFNDKLNQHVAEKTDEINKAQQEFKNAPEVGEARVFRARADLARELLNAHTITSPIFKFLSKNTTENILYDKFSFKKGAEGGVVELSGEALTYASLAYQADVLRDKKEISNFSISNITLTKFGTISFSITMVFAPEYLLYTKNISSTGSNKAQGDAPADASVSTVTSPDLKTEDMTSLTAVVATSTLVEEQASPLPSGNIGSDFQMAPLDAATTSVDVKETGTQAVLKSLWLKFKFW